MAGVQFDLCPETGIGCLMIDNDTGALKIDLMPDEAEDLKQLVKSGDLAGTKALLAGIDSKAETAMDGASLQALAQEIG